MRNETAVAAATTTDGGAQKFRSQVGHISRQSGVYFAGTLFTAATGYLFKVYLARVLGPAALGLYALGMTLVSFIGIFNTLGLPQSAVRFVAEYKARAKFKELHALLWRGSGLLLAANIVFAVILLTFGRWIAIRFYRSPALTMYLPLFALIMISGLLSNFYGKVLAGYRDLKLRTLIVSFVGSPLNMILAVGLISIGMGLRGYLVAQVMSGVIVLVLLIVVVRRLTPVEARFFGQTGSTPAKEIWSFSAAMLGIGFLEFAMSQVDRVALGFYLGAREVGIYSVAAALVAYVPLALGSVNQIFAPTIADLYARADRALLTRLFQSLTKWILGITFPLALVVILLARPLMRIFGHDFENGWPILVIGAIGQLVNCGVGSVGYLLLMSGHEKQLIKVQIVMATVMVVSSAALIPIWGIYGAAIAAAITNIGMNALNLLEVRRVLHMSPYNRSYIHLLLPAALTTAAVLAVERFSYVFHHDWIAVAVALITAYSVFPAVFYLLAGLDDDDRLIASALRSRLRFARSGDQQ